MTNIAELTIHSLKELGDPPFETYNACLRDAFAAHPPPHAKAWYGKLYRQLARKSDWFANSLFINSDQEGFGSRRIWEFSRKIEDLEVADLVRGHSMDESRHSKMFAGLLNQLFPGAITDERTRARLDGFSPGYTRKDHPSTDYIPEQGLSESHVIHELISINIVEIRALVLQYLLRPMLQAYATPEQQRLVTRASDILISDEVKHIRYSAFAIEHYAKKGNAELVRATILDRQKALNEEFLDEVATEKFD